MDSGYHRGPLSPTACTPRAWSKRLGEWRPSPQRYLGNKLIVLGQVCPTMDATVCAVAARQVAAESLGG